MVSVAGNAPEPLVSGKPPAGYATSQKFPLEQLKLYAVSTPVELLMVTLADGKLLGVTVE
jgi:hypothetical protein